MRQSNYKTTIRDGSNLEKDILVVSGITSVFFSHFNFESGIKPETTLNSLGMLLQIDRNNSIS